MHPGVHLDTASALNLFHHCCCRILAGDPIEPTLKLCNIRSTIAEVVALVGQAHLSTMTELSTIYANDVPEIVVTDATWVQATINGIS